MATLISSATSDYDILGFLSFNPTNDFWGSDFVDMTYFGDTPFEPMNDQTISLRNVDFTQWDVSDGDYVHFNNGGDASYVRAHFAGNTVTFTSDQQLDYIYNSGTGYWDTVSVSFGYTYTFGALADGEYFTAGFGAYDFISVARGGDAVIAAVNIYSQNYDFTGSTSDSGGHQDVINLHTSSGGTATVAGGAGDNDTLALNLSTGQYSTFSMTVSNIDTITGGSGADNIFLAGSISALTFDGGGQGCSGDTLTLANGGNTATLTLAHVESLVGGSGNDNITLHDALQTEVVDVYDSIMNNHTITSTPSVLSFDGGSGSDKLTLTGSNTTTLTLSSVESLVGGAGADDITLDSGNHTLTLDAVETLTGGTGADLITLAATTTGFTFNGGSSGSDSLTLADGTNTATLALTSVESLVGGSGADNITLSNAVTYTRFDGGNGDDTLTLANVDNFNVFLTNVESVVGGSGNDTIVITNTSNDVHISFNGNDGTDKLYLYDPDYAGFTGHLDLTNVDELHGTYGSPGDDITLTGDSDHTLLVDGIQSLTGGAGDDSITLANSWISAFNFNGGSGSDSLTLSDYDNLNTLTLTSVESLVGGNNGNSITLANALTGAFNFDGGSNSDSLTLAAGGNTTTLTLTSVESLTGGSGDDEITLDNGDHTLTLDRVETLTGGTGADLITLAATTTGFTFDGGTSASDSLTLADGTNTATLVLTSVESLVGGSGADSITLANALTGAFNFDGSSGSDSLTLTGSNSSTLTLTNVESLIGGSGDDEITLDDGAHTLTLNRVETLTGGTGADLITLAATTTGFTFDGGTSASDSLTLADGTNTATLVLTNVESLIGGSGDDEITLDDGAHTLTLNRVETLTGGTGADLITLAATTTGFTFDGGTSASDSLTLADGTNTATLTLTSVESLVGGSGADIITLANALTGAFNFDGGSGSDSLALTGSNTSALTLASVESLIGGSGNDSITLTSSSGVNINGANGDDTLVGGAGNDTIIGGLGADSIDGGAGTNIVSYAGSAAGVTVNLGTLVVSGGDAQGDVLSNFQNLIGSSQADNIVMSMAANNTAESVDAGDGNDLIQVIEGNAMTSLEANDTVDGGNGTDTMQLWDGNFGSTGIGGGAYLSLGDAVFAHVSGVEVLTGHGGNSSNTGTFDITLDANANVAFAQGVTVEPSANSGSKLILRGSTATMAITANGGDRSDNITTGAGGDIISGGAGTDTINVGGSDSAIDTVKYSVSDVSGVQTESGGTTYGYSGAYDTITGFESSNSNGDVIDLSGFTFSGSRVVGNYNDDLAGGANEAIGATDGVLVLMGSSVVEDGTYACTDIAAALDAQFDTSTLAQNEEMIFSVKGVGNNFWVGIYNHSAVSGDGVLDSEIQIVALVGVNSGSFGVDNNFSVA